VAILAYNKVLFERFPVALAVHIHATLQAYNKVLFERFPLAFAVHIHTAVLA
jgi:hypothetical protein